MHVPAPRFLGRVASAAFLLVLSASPGSSGRAVVSSASDGTWHPVPTVFQPTIGEREDHTIVFDPVRQRFLAFGGVAHYVAGYLNDVWERPVNGSGEWTPLTVTGTLPPGRRSHTAIYDPLGDRMIVFGGNSGGDRNDVWELTLGGIPHWNQLLPTGTAPSPRSEHTSVFDASRNRMVVYGGEGVPASDTTKTWLLDLTTNPPAWQSVVVPGTNPTWRAWQSAIFDPARDRMVMIGGGGPRSPFPRFDEVWTLSFSPSLAWTMQAAGNPAGNRLQAGSAYDSAHDRMIVTCGNGAGSSMLDDVALLDLGTFAWTTSTPADAPDIRYSPGFAFDPATQTGILQGGYRDLLPTSFTDTWALTFTPSATWTNVVPNEDPAPPGAYRYGAAGAYDPVRNRFLMSFGAFPAGSPWIKDDVLALQVGADSAWVRIGTQPPGFSYQRLAHSMTYDPPRDRMLVYGGYRGGSTSMSDLLEIQLSPTIEYVGQGMSGYPDGGRAYHATVLDPYRNRLVIFGGLRGTARNDVIMIDSLAAYANMNIAPTIVGTPPSARYMAGAVYDPWADRMLVFGGFDGTTSKNDLWSLSFNGGTSTWTQLTPAGTPPSVRHGMTMVLDTNRQRVLVYGGRDQAGNTEAGDLWQLTLGAQPLAWSQLAPAGTIPPARYNHVGIFDPVSDRLLVSGGLSHTGGTLRDVWRLQFGTATTAVGPPAGGPEFSLAGFSPNPATRDARVSFSLVDRTPATIEVVDVGGRRVAQRRIDSPERGTRTVAIAPRGGFAPGIYFIRLTQGTRTRSARGIVVR